MGKLKVLNVSPHGYTGLAYYDYSLCKSLSENGVDPVLCTSDRWILGSYKCGFKIEYLFRKCSGDISRLVKGINYIISLFRIYLYAARNRFPVVHFQIVELPLVDVMLMIALKVVGKHIVFTPHGMVHNKKYPFNAKLISLMFTISDRIIVHKNANRESIIRKFGVDTTKIRVIPHGGYEYFVDTSVQMSDARKRLGFAADDRILLFFGNIRANKGLDVLIKSMPFIKEKIPGIKLVIAGKFHRGMTREWLNKEIDKHMLSDDVITRLEFIPDKETLDYYMACDMVVLPYTVISESGVLRYAQTCGKAVVCSDLDEFKDTVVHGKTGYLFRKGDHVDLSSKIVAAFKDDNLEKIGIASKRLVEEDNNWNKIALRTKMVYDELMDKQY